ncbi:hypothetical protein C8Q73DRAFT_693581 [Cubamyces lactineus]|nr:hypothetical protein C8Q73DRAFT_693581 [Cubamyces lactineus]
MHSRQTLPSAVSSAPDLLMESLRRRVWASRAKPCPHGDRRRRATPHRVYVDPGDGHGCARRLDAGHRQAVQVAGVTGFLHDFDLSFVDDRKEGVTAECEGEDTDRSTAEAVELELKEQIGTFYFMAWDLLRTKPITVHDFRHDLESFYWVLCWVILQHTACRSKFSKRDGHTLCKMFFESSDVNLARAMKCEWFCTQDCLEIPGNVPLTTLVDKEAVVKAFDEALEMDGWPKEDGTIRAYERVEDCDPALGQVVSATTPNPAEALRDHPAEAPEPTATQERSRSASARGVSAPTRRSPTPPATPSSSPEPSTLAVLEVGPLTRTVLKRANDAGQLSPEEEFQRPQKKLKPATPMGA